MTKPRLPDARIQIAVKDIMASVNKSGFDCVNHLFFVSGIGEHNRNNYIIASLNKETSNMFFRDLGGVIIVKSDYSFFKRLSIGFNFLFGIIF